VKVRSFGLVWSGMASAARRRRRARHARPHQPEATDLHRRGAL